MMPGKSLSIHDYEHAIDTFLAANLGVVQRDDVGPLFGRLADLRRELRFSSQALAWAGEAMRAALAPDVSPESERTVRWTHVIASRARRTTAASRALALHARTHGAMSAGRKGTR